MSAIQLRWKAKALGFEKILLKGGILKGYFVSNPESSFYRSHVFTDLISYIQANPNRIKLSEKNNKLAISFSGIKSVAQANLMFDDLKKHVTPEPVISNH